MGKTKSTEERKKGINSRHLQRLAHLQQKLCAKMAPSFMIDNDSDFNPTPALSSSRLPLSPVTKRVSAMSSPPTIERSQTCRCWIASLPVSSPSPTQPTI